MRSVSRPLLSASLLSLFAVGLAACAPDGAELAPGGEVVGQGEHALEVKPGDPVFRNGLTVIAPEANLGVYAELLFDDGRTHTLHLRTDVDGTVFLIEDAIDGDEEVTHVVGEAAGEASASGSTAPCSDKAYKALPYKWHERMNWRFRAGSTPTGIGADAAEAKLKRAATNITASRNSCSMADQVGATQSYLGRTTQAAQITAAAACGASPDGNNVVDFGDLPDGTLGLACVWYDGTGKAVEADVRFNKVDAKWYADKPSSCSGRFSIEGVATHEFGHVFGLGHVTESKSGNLTMSPQINGACQNAEATLGRGDVLGLRAKY